MSEPIAAADGLVRVYRAHEPATGDVLVWTHGGGFQWGDLDMPEADWVSRAFAAHGVAVVSVDYRRASATVHFPTPSDDVLDAYLWTRAHAFELGADPTRVVIGGASAGANLTAGVALRLSGGEGPEPAGILLAYPTLHAVQPPTPPELQRALDELPDETPFDAARVLAMYEAYLGGPVQDASIIAIPGTAAPADLANLPPVLMINDDIDGLRVSGEAFAAALADAGVRVEVVTEPGTRHGHLNRPDEPQAAASVSRVLAWIATLSQTPTIEGLPS
jgi:acetyl esterase/lipase